jgi:hypothetical protein
MSSGSSGKTNYLFTNGRALSYIIKVIPYDSHPYLKYNKRSYNFVNNNELKVMSNS